MKLDELKPAYGASREAYRKGSGHGSANGKTAGRGHKGLIDGLVCKDIIGVRLRAIVEGVIHGQGGVLVEQVIEVIPEGLLQGLSIEHPLGRVILHLDAGQFQRVLYNDGEL